MTYQQAGRIAVLKRILGWVIFIPALVSTLISALKFMNAKTVEQEGINAVMLDFTHVMIDMMRVNTPFLNLFWYNSPTPDFHNSMNIMFWVIFILIFVGLAMQDSGARMSRQARFLREGVEDQLILEKAKGSDGLTREQIESRIVVPHHTIFLQFFPLYILPVIVIVLGYFLLFFTWFYLTLKQAGVRNKYASGQAVMPPAIDPVTVGQSPGVDHQTILPG